MTRLLRRFWSDDAGAVISVELVLIIGILIFGLVPGLVALRNSGISFMANLGNLVNAIIPSFTFSGYTITVGQPGGTQTTLLQVNGFEFMPTPLNLSASQVAPLEITVAEVPPSP